MKTFHEWLQEMGLPNPLTPDKSMAQDAVTAAMNNLVQTGKVTPLQVGQDPKLQAQVLKDAGAQAKKKGATLNVGAAASVLDPKAAEKGAMQ